MAAGDPTGKDLCVGTTNGDTLPYHPTTPEARQIVFNTPTTLTEGKKYAIVVRAIDSSGFNDGMVWHIKLATGGTDSFAFGSSDSGLTWSLTSSPVSNLWFQSLLGETVKDSYIFNYTGIGSIYYGVRWGAEVFTVSSTYDITSVILQLQRNGSLATPGTITVSIRATIALPEKPINPAPANSATDVTLDQATITWENGGGATSYDVYFGLTSGGLIKVSSGQVGTSFTITGITYGSLFDYLVSRSWRIDAVNNAGTTAGDVWTFTTIAFAPPLPTGLTPDPDNPGETLGTPSGENNMITNKRLVVAMDSRLFYEA